MSQDCQEFSVREVLHFVHDSLRFMRMAPLDRHWINRDASDVVLCTTGFRAQPLVRLVENVVKNSSAYLESSDPSSSEAEARPITIHHRQLGDVIHLLQIGLNRKLEWLADQGLFDSLLPWIGTIVMENNRITGGLVAGGSSSRSMCWAEIRAIGPPSPTTGSDAVVAVQQQTTEQSDGIQQEDGNLSNQNKINSISEVVIHVVDDVRGGQKDFTLPATILLEKMPYFAKATRGQVLSDVDITVHCDVNIFEWLTKWMNSPTPPVLDPTNVVPVLLSAAFLETETLVEECLHFCHMQTNQILDAKQSFSCLNDQLIEKLAAKFTATEVEQLGHQRSSLQSRLYACLIVDLCSTEPNPKRGIFRTASSLFFCAQCGQYLTEEVHLRVPCNQGRVVITTNGQIVYRHQRDERWTLTEHVQQTLKGSLKTWRRVYWRLWSQIHFLECSSCCLPFSAADFLKCPFHSEPGMYTTVARNKTNCQPIGRHPCCQMPAFRFSTVPNHQSGCRMREHAVSCLNLEQIQIMSMCRQFADLIQLNVSYKAIQPFDPMKLARCCETSEEVIPRFTLGLVSRPRRHLVPLPWQPDQGATNKDSNNRPKTATSSSQDSVSTSGSAESDEAASKLLSFRTSGIKVNPSGGGETSDPQQQHAGGVVCYEEEDDDEEDEVQEDEDQLDQELMLGPCIGHPSSGGRQLMMGPMAGRDGLKRMMSNGGVNQSGSQQQLMMVGMIRRSKFPSRRETKLKPQPPAREVDLRWNPCLSSRSNQDSQRYMEEEMFRRIVHGILAPPHWQKPRSPIGGLFAKIHRILHDKSQRELKQQQQLSSIKSSNCPSGSGILSSSSRSAISTASIAALAARKFKAQLQHQHQGSGGSNSGHHTY